MYLLMEPYATGREMWRVGESFIILIKKELIRKLILMKIKTKIMF
jgi:hypothetical protein